MNVAKISENYAKFREKNQLQTFTLTKNAKLPEKKIRKKCEREIRKVKTTFWHFGKLKERTIFL